METDLEGLSSVEDCLSALLGERLDDLTVFIDDVNIDILRLLCVDLELEAGLLVVLLEVEAN